MYSIQTDARVFPCAIVAFFLLATVAPAGALAQSATSVPRDPQATSAVIAALTAMGGTAIISAVSDATIDGNCTDKNGASFTTQWVSAGREFRYQTQSSSGSHIALSGHGSPAHVESGTKSRWSGPSAYVALPYHLPALLLFRELNDTHYEFLYKGTVQLADGQNATKIHAALAGPLGETRYTGQDWYFDQTTFLPLQIDYVVPAEGAIDFLYPVSIALTNYKTSSGIMNPTQVTSTANGHAGGSCSYAAPTFNTRPPASTFDPGGAQ